MTRSVPSAATVTVTAGLATGVHHLDAAVGQRLRALGHVALREHRLARDLLDVRDDELLAAVADDAREPLAPEEVVLQLERAVLRDEAELDVPGGVVADAALHTDRVIARARPVR